MWGPPRGVTCSVRLCGGVPAQGCFHGLQKKYGVRTVILWRSDGYGFLLGALRCAVGPNFLPGGTWSECHRHDRRPRQSALREQSAGRGSAISASVTRKCAYSSYDCPLLQTMGGQQHVYSTHEQRRVEFVSTSMPLVFPYPVAPRPVAHPRW